MMHFFLQGLQHPLLYPAHLIALIGLGLLLGQQGMRQMRSGWLVFLLLALLGLELTQLGVADWRNEVLLLILAGIAGALLALRLGLPPWLCALLAGFGALLVGLDSAPAMIPGMKAMKIQAMLAGTLVGASGVLVLLALTGYLLRNLLDGIVLRVIGSWVLASAMMVLTFMLVKP
ncbi:MAG: HupE/UreJ family protein [Thiothrix sp.]